MYTTPGSLRTEGSQPLATLFEKKFDTSIDFNDIWRTHRNINTQNIMRTKVLLLAAAVGMVGIGSSMAQVYSANAVGFYNVGLQGGYSLIANQLNNGDNNLNVILPDVPVDSFMLKWDAANQTFGAVDTFYGQPDGWLDDNFAPSSTTLGPGEGAFINLPAGSSATLTFVGEVPQGSLSTPLVPGYQILSQLTPQSIGFGATGMPAGVDDFVLFWLPGSQSYGNTATYYGEPDGWLDDNFAPADPTPAIGEAVFYNRAAGNGSATWTRDFSVNP